MKNGLSFHSGRAFYRIFLLLQKASKLVPHYHKMIFSYKSLLLYICDVHRNLFDCLINSSISSPAMETAKFFCRFSCFKLICYCSTILLLKQKKFACLSSQDKSLICLRAIYGKLPDRCRLRQEEKSSNQSRTDSNASGSSKKSGKYSGSTTSNESINSSGKYIWH